MAVNKRIQLFMLDGSEVKVEGDEVSVNRNEELGVYEITDDAGETTAYPIADIREVRTTHNPSE